MSRFSIAFYFDAISLHLTFIAVDIWGFFQDMKCICTRPIKSFFIKTAVAPDDFPMHSQVYTHTKKSNYLIFKLLSEGLKFIFSVGARARIRVS